MSGPAENDSSLSQQLMPIGNKNGNPVAAFTSWTCTSLHLNLHRSPYGGLLEIFQEGGSQSGATAPAPGALTIASNSIKKFLGNIESSYVEHTEITIKYQEVDDKF